MQNSRLIKYTAYCATALLAMVLPTGIIIDVEPLLHEVVSKIR